MFFIFFIGHHLPTGGREDKSNHSRTHPSKFQICTPSNNKSFHTTTFPYQHTHSYRGKSMALPASSVHPIMFFILCSFLLQFCSFSSKLFTLTLSSYLITANFPILAHLNLRFDSVCPFKYKLSVQFGTNLVSIDLPSA